MEETKLAAAGIGEGALAALGRGFDLANDFRLRFAKGARGRLVELDEKHLHDVAIPGGPTVRRVSRDIGCDKGEVMKFQSDILEFNQVCICIFNLCCVTCGFYCVSLFYNFFVNPLFVYTNLWIHVKNYKR
jgi:hypothetical protein